MKHAGWLCTFFIILYLHPASPPLTHFHPPPPLNSLQVSKLAKNEVLMLNIGSMCTGARVIAVSTLRGASDWLAEWSCAA